MRIYTHGFIISRYLSVWVLPSSLSPFLSFLSLSLISSFVHPISPFSLASFTPLGNISLLLFIIYFSSSLFCLSRLTSPIATSPLSYLFPLSLLSPFPVHRSLVSFVHPSFLPFTLSSLSPRILPSVTSTSPTFPSLSPFLLPF